MPSLVQKRNGDIVAFDVGKIASAICRAIEAEDGQPNWFLATELAKEVVGLLDGEEEPVHVEDIQDMVERVLVIQGYYEYAKRYILYREQRRQVRELKRTMNIDLVDRYVNKLDWRVKENANSQFSAQGLNAYVAGTVSANYWLNKVYPREIAEAHVSGDMHIHDLGAGLVAYCCGWDLYQLLEEGYRGAPGQTACAPPRHLRSALGQLISFFFSVQQDCAGAVAISSFDTLLAPFVHADGLSYEEVKQCVQEFVYQVNMPGRAGMQRPFTNITVDFTVPEHMREMPALVGGKPYGVYGDFQKEAEMIARAFFEVLLEGDGAQQPFPFPIPTVNITPDFPWESPAARALLLATARYGPAYFANFITSDMKPEDVRSFCCRLTLDLRELKKKGGGLFGASPLTGCYDERTRVLTRDGWKHFRDVTLNDEICTLNPETGAVEYHRPLRKFEYEYDGCLIRFVNGRFKSPLVTPNHNMLVVTRDGKHFFLPAEADFSDPNYRLPKTGLWRGEDRALFQLPELELSWDQEVKSPTFTGTRTIKKHFPPLSFAMKDFCRFLGAYVGDGSLKENPHGGYAVCLSHGGNERKRSFYAGILDRLGVKWHEEGGQSYVFCSAQLYRYLEENVGCRTGEKRIPREILMLDRPYLEALWEGLVQSGGSRNRTTGQVTYCAASPGLAEDVAELIFKLGYYTTVRRRSPKAVPSGGTMIDGSRFCYELSLDRGRSFKYCRFKKELVPYRGKVYCLEVPNHVMLVERDGYIMWCGNSIGVVTLNLPRLGYLSKDREEYFRRLGRLVDLAVRSLNIKRELVESFTEKGLHPFAEHYLRGVKRARGGYWMNHFGTVGVVGMNEACLNLLGVDIAHPDGYRLARDTLNFIRGRLVKLQQEYGLMYNLEATPAEGCSYRLARLDKECYPDIIVANEEAYRKGAAPYYTNSSMLPVNYTSDLFAALEHQSPLLRLYTGGSVFHIFLGEREPDPGACAVLVRRIFSRYELPYMSITPTYSVCQFHGYIFGRHDVCPKCGAACEVYSRVVGYYRPISAYNAGKRAEFEDRAMFDSAFSAL